MSRFVKAFAVAAPFAAACLLSSNPADACGGCFVPPSENTVVSGHRMALSVSAKQTVLWDQIEYQGNPQDFSWVLPIKPGARVEQADAAWFEALEASTGTIVSAPLLNCNGGGGSVFGCGSGASGVALSASEDSNGTGGGEQVTVVKQETVGPYESVTLSSKDAGALTAWLDSHGYEIPDDIQPIIEAYVEEGFDFIALKLIPGNGVNLMTPVRVITEGASPVLPLRMVSAGTGAFTSIILYVIGEGRWTTDNFPESIVPLQDLKWDGNTNDSNYAELREKTLSLNFGSTWIATYAQTDALFEYPYEPDANGAYAGGAIGYTYLQQAAGDGTTTWDDYYQCQQDLQNALYKDGNVVVDPCDPDTMVCGTVGAGEIDARVFSCGELTDLSTALVGMHPKDVWVTRLEANLPRFALLEDLALRAADKQVSQGNYHVTPKTENYECPAAPIGPSTTSKDGKSGPANGTALMIVALGGIAALLAARRRGFVRG